MPTIKRFEQQVAPVTRTRRIARSGTSAAAFGAPEAQAAAQFASQVTSIAQIGLREELKLEAEEKRKKQIANTRSRVNLARAQDRDYMANLRAKKGKSGSTVYDQAQIDFEEKFKNRVSEIEDPKERVLFEQAYSPHMNHNLDIASNHQFRETEIYNKETKFSLIEQEYADASANKHDHNFVTDSANIVKMQTRELYQDMGKEIADRKVAEATSSFHATMVGAYSQDANGYISANKYYQDNKDEIDGTVQIQIEKDLSNMRLTEASQIKTDRIVVSTDDYTEQLEAARAIKDPELRDRTVERVKVRHNEDANKRRVAKQVQYEGAIDKILDVHQRGRSQEEALVIANKLEGQSRLDAIKVTKWTYASSEKKAKVVTDQAVVMQVKEGIDNGKVTTPNQIQTMLAGKATPGDNKSTVDYLAKGGNKQGLKDSKVRSMYKNLFQQKPDDEPECKYKPHTTTANITDNPFRPPQPHEMRKWYGQIEPRNNSSPDHCFRPWITAKNFDQHDQSRSSNQEPPPVRSGPHPSIDHQSYNSKRSNHSDGEEALVRCVEM